MKDVITRSYCSNIPDSSKTYRLRDIDSKCDIDRTIATTN